MAKILSFIIQYRSYLIGAATILTIIIAAFLWMKKHDNSIRQTERASCDAEYAVKENERQSAINKANESAKERKKDIKSKSRPSGSVQLISVFREGSFSQSAN